MCDFAADADAAEQLMVGRTLSVKRVRELNAKDYFYQMLKDNPEMLKSIRGLKTSCSGERSIATSMRIPISRSFCRLRASPKRLACVQPSITHCSN
jgi:hypothetical protein